MKTFLYSLCNLNILYCIVIRYTTKRLVQKDTGFTVALRVKHDLRRTIPPGGHILRQEAGVVVIGVSDTGKAEVTDLKRNKHVLIIKVKVCFYIAQYPVRCTVQSTLHFAVVRLGTSVHIAWVLDCFATYN